jgi:hypothetical protein
MPGGRPKGVTNFRADIAKIEARKYVVETITEMVRLMRTSTSDAVRLEACEKLLNRAVGRPPQAVELTGKDGGPVQHEDVTNDAERFTGAIAGILARRAEESSSGETLN